MSLINHQVTTITGVILLESCILKNLLWEELFRRSGGGGITIKIVHKIARFSPLSMFQEICYNPP